MAQIKPIPRASPAPLSETLPGDIHDDLATRYPGRSSKASAAKAQQATIK
jgi:hypothetical protein